MGSIAVTITTGTAPYSFIWRKDGVFFSNEEDLMDLQVGNYRLTIEDANGCDGALGPILIDNVVGTVHPLYTPLIRV